MTKLAIVFLLFGKTLIQSAIICALCLLVGCASRDEFGVAVEGGSETGFSAAVSDTCPSMVPHETDSGTATSDGGVTAETGTENDGSTGMSAGTESSTSGMPPDPYGRCEQTCTCAWGNVCAPPCAVSDDCPPEPSGNGAIVGCYRLLDDVKGCVLTCDATSDCPLEMECRINPQFTWCIWPQ